MALDACSMSFWAIPKRLWLRLTALTHNSKLVCANWLPNQLNSITNEVMCPCGTLSSLLSSSLWTKFIISNNLLNSNWLLHFGKDITNYFAALILSHRGQLWISKKSLKSQVPRQSDDQCLYLWPWQTMIHVIFHLIVLRQAQQIAVLHVHQIVGLKFIHFTKLFLTKLAAKNSYLRWLVGYACLSLSLSTRFKLKWI